MKLTLFSRLVFGYLAIFILVVGVSVYAIIQLGRFDNVIQSVLARDSRLSEYEQKLNDALLSQVRYERKYIITKDRTLYDQYLLFKRDFERYLEEAISTAGEDSQAAALLISVKGNYQRYQGLLAEEMKYLNTDRHYAQSRYAKEKEETTDQIITALERLRIHSQQSVYGKINRLSEAGAEARRVAMLIIATSLAFIFILSVLITRSITHPISVLTGKTREIARGNFEGDLSLSSPPEIAELARAFNFMCDKLSDLDKMKSEFFSSISHELRTPLTSIKEGTRLLLEGVGGTTTDKQKQLLTILREESERLIHLVNSLLDLSKMEAGMMTYSFGPASLPPLIHKAMTEIGPLVEAKRITLKAELAPELPSIKMDSERILQTLRNLIGNAVKFTPEGGQVTISTKTLDRRVEVSVRDTGPGVPAEDLATVFDKFQQTASNGPYRIKGTGLGLAIAKHIVNSHGGEIWAESQPGQGSSFIFVLPA